MHTYIHTQITYNCACAVIRQCEGEGRGYLICLFSLYCILCAVFWVTLCFFYLWLNTRMINLLIYWLKYIAKHVRDDWRNGHSNLDLGQTIGSGTRCCLIAWWYCVLKECLYSQLCVGGYKWRPVWLLTALSSFLRWVFFLFLKCLTSGVHQGVVRLVRPEEDRRHHSDKWRTVDIIPIALLDTFYMFYHGPM